MLNPGLYHFALKELHRKFGNPQVVSRACTSSLLKLQPFKDSDFHALRNFAANLHSVVATLQLGGYGMELHSNSTLSQLVSKLPPVLRSRWGEKSWAMQPNLPTVVDFDTWLDNVSMAEFCVRADASYSQQQSTQPPTRPHREASSDKSRRHPRPAVFTTTTTPACPVCKANHHLKDCKQFKGLPVEKRVVVVKENNICYRCLDRNHLSPVSKNRAVRQWRLWRPSSLTSTWSAPYVPKNAQTFWRQTSGQAFQRLNSHKHRRLRDHAAHFANHSQSKWKIGLNFRPSRHRQ